MHSSMFNPAQNTEESVLIFRKKELCIYHWRNTNFLLYVSALFILLGWD